MTTPKKLAVIETIFDIPGAAPVLAAKIIGRVIDQVARGFGEDENIPLELSIYKAIQAKYPNTVTMPDMMKSMLRRANDSNEDTVDMLEGLDDEAKEIWGGVNDGTEKQALLNARMPLAKLYTDAEENAAAWDELPTIAQWSLLNSTEVELPKKVSLWKGYADTDRAANKTNTNATRRQAEAEAAIEPFAKLVTAFLKNKAVKEDLALELSAGTNVPPRLAIAA
jgi:hypothetical protein